MRTYVAEWREAKDLTQDQLAERANTNKGTISKLENNKMKMTMNWLEILSYALGIEAEDLFHHPDKPSANDLLRGLPEDKQRIAIGMIKAIRDEFKKTGS